MTKSIHNELKYLFWGETASAIMFPLLYLYSVNVGVAAFQWLTLLILLLFSLVLLQGAYYWHTLRTRLKEPKRGMTKYQIGKVYSKLKFLNWSLIGLMAVLFLLQMKSVGMLENLLRSGMILFTAVEQINYFYIRLSYYGKTRLTLQVIKPIKLLASKTGKKAKIAEEISLYHSKDAKAGEAA